MVYYHVGGQRTVTPIGSRLLQRVKTPVSSLVYSCNSVLKPSIAVTGLRPCNFGHMSYVL